MGEESGDRDLVDEEVKPGTRLIALALLEQADAAFSSLSRDPDEEALHDFRVALRRLRSHVRSYRVWLRESVSRKQERRLRRIARASNSNRDVEVLLQRLQALPLAEDELITEELASEWRARLEKEQQTFHAQASAAFPVLARRLRRGLSTYTADLHVDGGAEQRLGEVAAEVATRLRAELHSALLAVRSIEHQEEAHEARIAGKRLRYLLEPFAERHSSCATAVELLKQLQDALGDLHDAHALLLEVERSVQLASAQDQSGALALVLEAARAERSASFARAEREYFEPQAERLLAGIDAALDALAREDRGSRIEDRGSRVEDRGSGITDLV